MGHPQRRAPFCPGNVRCMPPTCWCRPPLVGGRRPSPDPRPRRPATSRLGDAGRVGAVEARAGAASTRPRTRGSSRSRSRAAAATVSMAHVGVDRVPSIRAAGVLARSIAREPSSGCARRTCTCRRRRRPPRRRRCRRPTPGGVVAETRRRRPRRPRAAEPSSPSSPLAPSTSRSWRPRPRTCPRCCCCCCCRCCCCSAAASSSSAAAALAAEAVVHRAASSSGSTSRVARIGGELARAGRPPRA